MKSYYWISLSIFTIFLAACVPLANGSDQLSVLIPLAPLSQTASSASPNSEQRDEIILPISVFIIDDEVGDFSSARTVEEIEQIYEKANQIWGQANIRLELEQVERVEVPHDIGRSLNLGQYRTFFQGVGTDFDLPRASLIYAFYTQEIGGPNGLAPFGSRSFFVMDTPSVHDERVTAHEIGHILGLHHTLYDEGRLMFPGTNGMVLTEEEIVVARYAAQGLLGGVR